MAAVGVHCILELYGCPASLLDDAAFVTGCLRRASARARVSLLAEISHRFQPQGVTALGLLADSHISIHTWPERGYAAADLFTCGRGVAAAEACRYLAREFQARRSRLRRIARGVGAETPAAPPRKRRPAPGGRRRASAPPAPATRQRELLEKTPGWSNQSE